MSAGRRWIAVGVGALAAAAFSARADGAAEPAGRVGLDAADPSPQADRPALEWNVALELALGYAHSEKSQPPLDGWQDRFRPAGGSMALADYAWAGFLDLGLSAGPAVRLRRGWTIGLPVSYALTVVGEGGEPPDCCFTPRKSVAVTSLRWWDSVTAMAVKLQKTPSVGLAVAGPRFGGQLAVHGYRLWLQDYRGIDRSGAPNSSRPAGGRDSEHGLGLRADGVLRGAWLGSSARTERLGVYLERDGAKTWLVGMTYAMAFRLFE